MYRKGESKGDEKFQPPLFINVLPFVVSVPDFCQLISQGPIPVFYHHHLKSRLGQTIMIIGREAEDSMLADKILFAFQVIADLGLVWPNGFNGIDHQGNGIPMHAHQRS